MKFETLQSAMVEAMKARDKERKDSISVLVSAAKKVAIDAGCREDIPEEMVDQAILKEIKALLLDKYADVIASKNKGLIMKSVMGELKGKADGKLINQVVADLTK